MIRRGSLVEFNKSLVENHPVYGAQIGKRFKVDGMEGKTHAMIGEVRIPVKLLVGIPQKKGKNYTSKDHQKAA